MYYFAYGSNMCTGRLRGRVPSAKPLFVLPLYGYRLRFHKRSSDRSGKADAEFTGNQADVVWDVVFEIDAHEKSNLDQAEGLGHGYDEKEINLKDCNNQNYKIWLYLASDSHKNAALKPYGWYLRFVIEGAKQHALPGNYIALLEQVQSVEDQNRGREARERSIRCR